MSKIDELTMRLAALQLEMERRFGQVQTVLILIAVAVVLSIGPQSHLGQLLIGLMQFSPQG